MSNVFDVLAPVLAQAADTGGGGAAAAGVGGFFLIVILLGLVASVFWIWMLIDAITSSLPSTEKLIWVLVIFFLHLLGAILYFFIGRKNARVLT